MKAEQKIPVPTVLSGIQIQAHGDIKIPILLKKVKAKQAMRARIEKRTRSQGLRVAASKAISETARP